MINSAIDTVETSVDSILAEMQEQTRQEKELHENILSSGPKIERKAIPQIKPLNVSDALRTNLPPKKSILAGYIYVGTVGMFVGKGGVGKSYMELLMAAAAASGRTIPPFDPTEPVKVLLVNVEDGADDLHRRLYAIHQEYQFTDKEQVLLSQNLIILPGRGQIGPLMLKDGTTPVESEYAAWLRQQIEIYNPDLVFLDTKARLYGLDENNPDDGSQWVALLESMLVGRPDLTFLVVSHTAKHNSQSEDQYAIRGGGSVADNSRFVLVLCHPQPTDMEGLDGSDPMDYAKLVHSKASYSRPRDIVFFARNPHGVPVMTENKNARSAILSEALDRLVLILREDYPEGLNRRSLERGTEDPFKRIKQEVLESAGLKGKRDWLETLSLGIESTRIETFQDKTSNNKNKPVLVRVRCQ
jgi:RecA-family ATPase